MPAYCSQEDIWDHNRDLIKNYIGPEPLSQPITALEVAILVNAIPLVQGAALIEQYARTVAAAARLDAVAAGARP
jgi:hypothetical protein